MGDVVFLAGPESQHQVQAANQGEGPYPPLERPCHICGKQAWIWTGDAYKCGSGDPAHQEYEEWYVKTFGSRT